MVRRILASEWAAAALSVCVLLLHIWWFSVSENQGDVLSGLGGSIAALGIYVAAQPYIRKGLIETAREQAGLHHPGDRHDAASARHDEAEVEGILHVVKERIVGVALVAFGSLLNGYGPAIAHLFSLKGA